MIGETLGSFRVVQKLGEGGMGIVYLVEHPLIHKFAAAKVLLPRLSLDQEIVNRFFNEARAATLLKHPGVVEIFDFGYHSSGSAFILMEYLEGESLSSRLARERKLAIPLAVDLSRQVAGALGAAHAKGIVHRDLKPDNIHLVADDECTFGVRAKVLDFGIAKLLGDTSTLKTNTGAFMGTPAYMSPEQCRGAGLVDHRSDVYSLGCVMYELLSGDRPFVAEGAGEIVAAHLFQAPPRLGAPVPPALAEIVARTLEKKLETRIQSMPLLVSELQELDLDATVAGVMAMPPAPRRTGPVIPATTTLGSSAAEVKPATAALPQATPGKGLPRALVIGGPALLVVALAITGLALRSRSAPHGAGGTPEVKPQIAAVVTPPPPSRPPPPARDVKLSLRSLPTDAEVSRADGSVVGRTPMELLVERDSPDLRLTFKLAGHRDETISVHPAGDLDRLVKLVRVKATHVEHEHQPGQKKKTIDQNAVVDPFASPKGRQ